MRDGRPLDVVVPPHAAVFCWASVGRLFHTEKTTAKPRLTAVFPESPQSFAWWVVTLPVCFLFRERRAGGRR